MPAPNHFVYRLIPPRPTFDQDMSGSEREIMGRHAEYFATLMQSGKVVVYGPVRDSSGSWGLGVLEAGSRDEVQAIAASDPAVTSGLATIDVGTMLGGFVRS